MALNIATTGETITLDETAGLQNATATPAPAGDANDNDIANTALPTVFSARLTALGLGAPTIGTALSGYTGVAGNTGSNIISVTPAPGGAITDLGLVGPGGAPLNGLDSGLDTLSGANILLYTDTNNNIVLGREEGTNAIVFALYLEETGTPVTGAKMWTVQYAPLLNTDPANHDDALNLLDKVFVAASQDLEFSLAGAPSGQNLFLMFTTANPTTQVDGNGITRITDPTIIATGKDPANQSTGVNITTGDTINTSQAGGPTTFGTNSQMITEQEGIRFTFVTGAREDVTIPNLDQNEADVEANIDFTSMFNARAATFDVVQLQSGKSAVVKVTALSTAAESGVNFIDGYGNDSTIAITHVKVLQGTTVLIDTSTGGTANGVTVAFNAAGVATISGVQAGYTIEYTTTGDHNRVLIENGAALDARGNTHADFDIGGFQLLQVSTATVEVGSKVSFEDDGPTIAANTEPTPTLTTDDTEIVDTAGPVSFAGLFTSAFGNDGFKDADDDDVQDADAITYALGVSGANAVSGLTDTLTGDGVVLNKVGNDIVGTAGAGGPEVLRIAVDASGSVMLTQSRAVVHDDPLDPSESTSPAALLSADLVTLAATITDGDGDTATATLTTDDTEIPDTAGPTSFAGLFTSAFGTDSFKGSDDNDIQDADAITYALGVSGANAVSGLTDTLTGDGVVLNKVGNDIVGTAGAAGPEVLRITVDASGNVALSQSRAVVHDDPLDPSESASPATLLTADLVTLAATITDGDGDTATATRNIGDAFKFEDDGLTLDFGNLVGTGTIAPQYGEWSRLVGADQPGNLDISLNQSQLVRPNGTTINGSSFTFNELAGSPDASGNFLFAGSLTADFDNIVSTPDTTVDFTLTALNDGRYVFDLVQGFGSTVTFSSEDGSLDAGGPDPVRTLTIPPDEQVVFFGVQATTSDSDIVSAIGLGEPDLTEAQVEAGGFAFLGAANMNVSTSGIGIGNNNLDGDTTAGITAADESFIINPETLLTGMKVFIDNSVGGYDPATEELYYKIFFDDGSNSGNIKVLSGDLTAEAGGQVSFGIETQGSKLIDSVQLTMGKGVVKIPVIEFIQATENLASDVLLDFAASLTDADGDSATSDFSVDLFANDLEGTFDFTLTGASGVLDSFNIDLSALQDSYKIEGFDTPDDQLALLGDLGATVSIDNSGADSIISVTETGGQTTSITVVGVDLVPANIVIA
ncbi:DUF5801 repeats-in-toxin domain-containing protein [Nitrosomonas sp. Nm132]|uniref:DUF5801 repeats-in-toxin domain-containing protein n=1 Tax=Nitrosomonas sp. Nm132 TaxID=1881053 RepID=UPI00088CC506|nr:DUF5801 repeats-in-toxin domain-containing protein [Nitrosomonas sp. Nm132]SDH11690.1 hypothetical protein SAMN05428952_1005120 [Nitrosomonas sp. Nm132]